MSDDTRTRIPPTLEALAAAHRDEINIIRARADRAEEERDRLRDAVVAARDLLTAAVPPSP